MKFPITEYNLLLEQVLYPDFDIELEREEEENKKDTIKQEQDTIKQEQEENINQKDTINIYELINMPYYISKKHQKLEESRMNADFKNLFTKYKNVFDVL